MSKERELLKRSLASLDKLEPHSDVIEVLCKRIKELLAQPEQENLTPRQGLAEYKKGYAQAERDLKREPLSDEQVEAAREGNTITVHAFARAIEKAHGIGE